MKLRTIVALTALVTTSASVYAQAPAPEPAIENRNYPAQRFYPSKSYEGLLDVDWADTPGHFTWDIALWLNYARNPIMLYERTGGSYERVGALVRDRLEANIVGAVQVLERFELAFDLPMTLVQGRADSLDFTTGVARLGSLSSFGVGDFRLIPKVTLLKSESAGLDLALLATIIFPSGKNDGYFGESGYAVLPTLALSRAIGPLRVAANIGYTVRTRVDSLGLSVDDEIFYRVAYGYRVTDQDVLLPVELDVGVSGSFLVDRPFKNANESPLELLGAARFGIGRSFEFGLGVGAGIGRGIGSPDVRVLGTLRVFRRDTDLDGDGILDKDDACPEQPEDMDGFEDEDGCPDVDNDKDDVLDGQDGAPNIPEDRDGFEDQDGVPETDNDQDGILDPEDACPNEAGPAENEGCPNKDTDKDGVFDREDQCPTDPEDKDGFQDEDGCPEVDNDNDGLLDAADECPNEAGPPENRGCPDQDRDGDGVMDRLDNCPDEPGPPENSGCKQRQLVRISSERLEILDRVYFETNKDVIRSRSYALLDNVAAVILAHPEIKKIVIEGHTDSVGSSDYNKTLSQRRAESVRRYLMKREVPGDRVAAEGYGEERPVAENESERGRADNRRVEFKIPRASGEEGGDMQRQFPVPVE